MALQDLALSTVTGLGYELVELERSAGGLLRVTIDLPWTPGSEALVTVEDCEKVTRQLQYALPELTAQVGQGRLAASTAARRLLGLFAAA